jgi:hypothetical protein
MERDSLVDRRRHEVLPFGSVVEQAEAVGEPLTLTVTCSHKRGPDRTVELAGELRGLGHTVIVHIGGIEPATSSLQPGGAAGQTAPITAARLVSESTG